MFVYNSSWRLCSIIVVLALIPACLCDTKCYVCSTSSVNFRERCGDEFTLKNIDAEFCQGSCWKARTDDGVVDRGCVYPPRHEECIKGDYYKGVEVEKCYCNSEYCNTATSFLASPYIVLLSLGLLLVKYL